MLSGIRLRYYTDSEIKSLAVVRVQNASTYDRGVPKLEGINDPRMGVVDHTVRCPTCYLANCDQHFGYIQLSKPVYRVGTINTVMLVLRCVCRECAKPKFTGCGLQDEPTGLIDTRGLVDSKASKGNLRSISEMCRSRMQCEWCGAPQPNYIKRDRTFMDATYRSKDLTGPFASGRGKPYLDFLRARFMPEDAAAILHGLAPQVADALGIDRPSALMCHLQLVPPPAIRPSNFVGADGSKVRSENDLTSALQDIVRTNIELQNAMAVGSESLKTVAELHDKLQVMVSGMVNHAIKKTAAQKGMLPLVAAAAKRKVIAIKDRLNGKKARVRGNLNGKRVDQSGRTVISGDASHDIDQLGVPRAMMNKLSFPEPVTNLNRFDLEASVIKGPYVDMGALAVRQPNCGSENIVWLPVLDREARIDLAAQLRPGWIVERHLRNGDWVLFNRQPSLWKASMMAFRCYAVDGLTVRLPLSVTPAFNADFDGDEMNLHALQGYAAIAEAQELMSVPNQMVTPQSNSIIIGLVQDSLSGAYRLSKHDCFLTHAQASTVACSIHYQPPKSDSAEAVARYEAMQKDGPRGRELESSWTVLAQPAVLKGTGPDGRSLGPLWTGKQMVSMLMPYNVNTEKTKTSSATGLDVFTEAAVVVRGGQLLTGRLCKATLGKANTGLPHAVWRLYGPWAASKFVSDAQRVFIRWLAYDGPSISIVDCMAADEEAVMAILSRQMGRADALLKLDLPWAVKEHKSNSMLQETLRSVGSEVLKHVDPNSALACNVNSGSKGNVMNIAQIGGVVGQQTVYGKRVPIRNTRLGPRTLACYAPGDLRAEARGFVVNSYLGGLTPAEFFLHQMAGREGIVATAVNTADSGYNQRRMIKGQESQCITYDGTVRVAANAVVQTLYGGDDLDGSRLERVRFSWLLRWRHVLSAVAHVPEVARCASKLVSWAVWRANLFKDLDFAVPCGINLESHVLKPVADAPVYLQQAFQGLTQVHARVHSATRAVLNLSVAAAMLQAAKAIVDSGTCLPLDELVASYSKAMAHAGEGVGALGASSIGEPSMQLTLNVFHYSGIASKNVTITGLPRFKQLINAVDSYESANMTAELSSLQHADLAMDCQTVMLRELLVDIHGPEPAQLGPFQLAACLAFFTSGPGPLLQKLKCKEAFNPTAPLLWLRIELDPTACVRAQVKTLTVANALRDTFGADAMVLHVPYWGLHGHTIAVVLHTALTKENGEAIVEALKNQHQVKGLACVKKALVLQDRVWAPDGIAVGRHVLETEGSNLLDLAKSDCVQTRSIVTNNAIEACRVFGITTGLTVLQSELHKVLSFDSAYIDPRHTWLLADTMGRTGTICAMNRHHMQALGSSLLQEASFERSMECFENGATFAITDPLAGATERIIIGQPVAIGTGLVAIVAEKIETPKAVIVTALPREREDPSVRTIVGPLFSKGPKFAAESFAERIADMSKECSNGVAVQTAAMFRSLAASRRICPSVSVSKKVSEATLRSVLSTCRNYALWTSTESTTLVTLVEFEVAGRRAVTSVPQVGTPKTVDQEVMAAFEDAPFKSIIWVEAALPAHAVPISVNPDRVTLQQRTTFVKGGWTLMATKEWHGANNVEAERAMLQDAPECWCCLQASEPEGLLQSRCTTEQLGNAFVSRLP